MKQLSLKEAKRLSIIKWEAIINGDDLSKHPELDRLIYRCGFCERWLRNFLEKSIHDDETQEVACSHCEFAKAMGYYCTDERSIFSKWCDMGFIDDESRNEMTILEMTILELIKSIPEEE